MIQHKMAPLDTQKAKAKLTSPCLPTHPQLSLECECMRAKGAYLGCNVDTNTYKHSIKAQATHQHQYQRNCLHVVVINNIELEIMMAVILCLSVISSTYRLLLTFFILRFRQYFHLFSSIVAFSSVFCLVSECLTKIIQNVVENIEIKMCELLTDERRIRCND